ncbi:MAG TPA: ketohexokinase [Gammaproteobacteria bacterium]|nr:ketohexokinase [Gammaproteobacteria bacterium]
MARILVVGIATLDIINTVDAYPAEDSEVRARARCLRRGGNAANTAVVLAQLGHQCQWAGTLAEDASGAQIREDLLASGVNLDAAQTVAGGGTPTSYVTLSAANGSRSIVHFRQLPEYSFPAFSRIELDGLDWIHFEGRNITETRAMLDHVHAVRPALPCSVEIEKPRPGIEALCTGPALLLYSRDYVRALAGGEDSVDDPVDFLQTRHRQLPRAEHVCAWAEGGAWGVDPQGQLVHAPAWDISPVVDTLGAGDTFNAGLIDASLAGLPLATGLHKACSLAGRKCAQQGFQGLCATQ